MRTLLDLAQKSKNLNGQSMWSSPFIKAGKERLSVHILAMGDVGSTVLLALKMLGGDVIRRIGICDLNEKQLSRLEIEMNQVAYPWDYDRLPEVEIVQQKDLFTCDVFVFCATKGIAAVGEKVEDVRMAQYEANRGLISIYGQMARKAGFKGFFAVVSDPVDLLCQAAYKSSNMDAEGRFDGKGLCPNQIQGYGLGVMNARAAYYAKRDPRFVQFLTEGRVFGPHGRDLIVADSIKNYNEELSLELTNLTVTANLKVRELGYKPYIAPALSSAAISLLLTIRGEYHYSAVPLGDVWFGCKNRMKESEIELEILELPDPLFERIKRAYRNLGELA